MAKVGGRVAWVGGWVGGVAWMRRVGWDSILGVDAQERHVPDSLSLSLSICPLLQRNHPDTSDNLGEQMKRINLQNKERAATGNDVFHQEGSATGGDDTRDVHPDFIPYGTGMNLPFLPFAFNHTCAWCGKTDVTPDNKSLVPLDAVGMLLENVYAVTPWVYNVLYQMVNCPELETAEAIKWQKIHRVPVPNYLRFRVCICPQCMPPVKERAQCMAVAGESIAEEEWEGEAGQDPVVALLSAALGPIHSAGSDVVMASPTEVDPPAVSGDDESAVEQLRCDGGFDPEKVLDTKTAFKMSFDPLSDVWEMKPGPRITSVVPRKGMVPTYIKESGRKFYKYMQLMFPMDIVIMMVCHPDPRRVPEYRSLNRNLRILAGLSSGAVEDSLRAGKERAQCLYLSFPILPLHILVAQVRCGQVALQGGILRGNGTISDRVFLSVYAATGKRRVSQGDSNNAVVIRRCHEVLRAASLKRHESHSEKGSSRRLVSLGGFNQGASVAVV